MVARHDPGERIPLTRCAALGITVRKSRSRKARWPLEVENRAPFTVWPQHWEPVRVYKRLPRDVNPDFFARLEPGAAIGCTL